MPHTDDSIVEVDQIVEPRHVDIQMARVIAFGNDVRKTVAENQIFVGV